MSIILRKPFVTLGKSSTKFVELYVFDERGNKCGTLFFFFEKDRPNAYHSSGYIPDEIKDDMSNIGHIALSVLLANEEEKNGLK